MLKLVKAGKGRFPVSQQRPRIWLVAIVILIGAFMRLHDLAAVPPSAGYDVAYYGLDALDILQGHFPIYLESNFGREAMFSYLVAFLYATIGVGDFAIHLAAAFVGILTLPATYILMEELLRNEEEQLIRRFAPLLATACLAVMYWHVVWSRFGVRAILAPMFITVNLFSLLRALRTHRRVYFVAAGLTAGLSLYTYQIGQLVPFLVVAIVVIDWIHRRRQRPFVAHVKSLGWLVAAAVSSALPLVIYMRRNPETFNYLLSAQNPQTGNPIWGQHDSEPCQTFYPTTVWHQGEVIRDPITLTPSPDIPPGDYQLSIGFYSWPDLQRLPVGEADAFLLHAVQIGDSDG